MMMQSGQQHPPSQSVVYSSAPSNSSNSTFIEQWCPQKQSIPPKKRHRLLWREDDKITALAFVAAAAAANNHSTTVSKRNSSLLTSPIPGGCHGRTSRNNSYCRRTPCYNGSRYCKLHYQQYHKLSSDPNGNFKNKNEEPQIADKRFTGLVPEESPCQATTTRGRPCAYVAVGNTKYCNLHADYDTNPPPRRSSSSTPKTNTLSSITGICLKAVLPNKDILQNYPLLNSIPSDQWANQLVMISAGPFTNHTGRVVKWGNGWVSVQIHTTNTMSPAELVHNRRAIELYLLPSTTTSSHSLPSSHPITPPITLSNQSENINKLKRPDRPISNEQTDHLPTATPSFFLPPHAIYTNQNSTLQTHKNITNNQLVLSQDKISLQVSNPSLLTTFIPTNEVSNLPSRMDLLKAEEDSSQTMAYFNHNEEVSHPPANQSILNEGLQKDNSSTPLFNNVSNQPTLNGTCFQENSADSIVSNPHSDDPSKNQDANQNENRYNSTTSLEPNENVTSIQNLTQDIEFRTTNSEHKASVTNSIHDHTVTNIHLSQQTEQNDSENQKNKESTKEDEERDCEQKDMSKTHKNELHHFTNEKLASCATHSGLSLMEELILAQTGRRVSNLDLVLGCPRTIQKPKRYEDTEMIEKK